MVPHLITALTGAINELEARVLESMPAIERWFRLEWMEHTPPFYSAVTLRNAGFKLAPVATNLFPGGFDNLTPEMLPLAVQAAMAAIEKICPEAKNLLLVPRVDVADPTSLRNVQQLVLVFHQAGLNVRLGSLDEAITVPTALQLADGSQLIVEPMVRSRGRLGLKGFDPCTILLNNNLSGGTPRALQSLEQQYLLPPLHAGGAVRRKSRHFQSYEEVAKKFAKLLGMDPWLINPMVVHCGEVDLRGAGGIAALQAQTEALLTRMRRKYKEYGINERPFVVVKSDRSADDIGALTIRDPKDLEALASSGAAADAAVVDLIVQEGVPTHERIRDAVAEPVVLMIDRYVVGGYYRVHAERGIDDRLDTAGSAIVPLAFADSTQLPRPGAKPGASAPNRFYMHGVIGRLAMVAASYELEATDPDAEVYE